MQEFIVPFEVRGFGFKKVSADNYQEAVNNLEMKLSSYDVDMENFKIPTLDGEQHVAELEDIDITYDRNFIYEYEELETYESK
jgi:hypothetical protein